MKLKYKVIISLFTFVLILLASTFYFISEQIKPEKIKKIAIELIEETFPKSRVVIGNIRYKIGPNIKLNIHDVFLKDREKKRDILTVKKFQIKIPILAILKNGGVVDISTTSPEVFLEKENEKFNYERIFVNKDQKVEKKDAKSESIEIPSFLQKSKINFKVSNLITHLMLKPNNKSIVNVKKINIKNINLKTTTAFEINSSISYQLSEADFFKSNIQLIGAVHLKKLIYEQKIDLKSTFKVSDTGLSSMNQFKIPMVKGNANIQGAFSKLLIDLKASLINLGELTTNVKLNDESIILEQFNIDLGLKSAIGFLPKEHTELLEKINFGNSLLNINGDLAYSLKNSALSQNLKVKTTEKIDLRVIENIPISTTFLMQIKNDKLSFSSENDVLGGKAILNLNTELELLKFNGNIEELNKIFVDLNLSNLNLPKQMIHQKIWSKENPERTEKTPAKKVSFKGVVFPDAEIKVRGKNILLANNDIKVALDLITKNKKFDIPNFTLLSNKGSVKSNIKGVIKNDEQLDIKSALNIKNVNATVINPFLPPMLSEIKGMFSSSLDVKMSYGKKLIYNVDGDVNAKKGEMKNLNLSSFITPLVSNIKLLKSKVPKNLNVSDRFESLNVKLKATNKIIRINKMIFNGSKKELTFNTSGYLSMNGQNSRLEGKFYIKKLARDLRKITGQTQIPYLLKGKGFKVLPVYDYTLKKFAKYAGKSLKKNITKQINKEKKKVEKKIRKKIKKEEKKIQKNIKKEEKKLKNKLENEIKNKLKGFKF